MLAFVTVAQYSTFAEAAERLYLSQPALSTSIKNMESVLGGQLLSRSTRKVELTPEGQAFLPIAKRLIGDWENAIADVKAQFSLQHGHLVVAAMPSFAESILPKLLNRYHQYHPGVRIRVLDVVMEEVIKSVLEGRAELGFVFEPENLTNLDFQPIMQDSFIVVMKPSHPLANLKSLTMEQLIDYPMVSMNKGSSVRYWIDKVFESLGFEPKILVEAYQLGTLGQLLNFATQDSEHAFAIVPQLCLSQMQRKSLVGIKLNEASLSKAVGVISASRKPISAAATNMLKYMMG
ncbi:LysR substrate-binding domain-containing protein [Glaciecola sp. 1036]|uniref:LysR substrate-binding domain-containing protein n=1 Tax=Alteromonadaceae TaxID=72275 RepID=UPI003D031D4E